MKLTRQLIRFLVTGGVNTAFGYFVYALGVLLFDFSHFRALVLSYVVGVTFSYFMFRAFVFTEGERGWKSYQRFVPTYVGLFIVNAAGLYLLVDVAGWNKLLAQAVIVPVCAALSFIINRLFVFRK